MKDMSVPKSLCRLLLTLLMLPSLAFAGNVTLLDADAVASRLGKTTDYQLLDARGAEAQRRMPLAFAMRYQPMMVIRKGLVFVVADSDEAALEIVKAIPTEGRTVHAVKGGADGWKQGVSRLPTQSAMPDKFVIPKSTCEAGKPVTSLKSNKVLEKEKK